MPKQFLQVWQLLQLPFQLYLQKVLAPAAAISSVAAAVQPPNWVACTCSFDTTPAAPTLGPVGAVAGVSSSHLLLAASAAAARISG